jgi:hypothetical protein
MRDARRNRPTWAKLLRATLAALALGLALGPALAAPVGAAGADYAVAGGWFFSQTGGGTGAGFTVRDAGTDANGHPLRFWSEFQRLGGVPTLGYPVGEPYLGADGFTYQPFQRALLQWRPDLNAAVPANTFEILQAAGQDGWLATVKGVPPPITDDGSGGDYAKAVATRLGWLTNPAIRAAFLANPSPATISSWGQDQAIQLYGLPMSRPEQYGPFISQRFQRISFQLWTVAVPGMPAPGTVVGILGGDLLKEAGLLPASAIQPQAPGGSAAAAPRPSDAAIYQNALAPGWQNWSWGTQVDFAAAPLDGPGQQALAFTYQAPWAGLNLHTSGLSTSGYQYLQFSLNGGTASDQQVQIAVYDTSQQPLSGLRSIDAFIQGGAIAANQWRTVTIPLSSLGATNRSIRGIVLQDGAGHPQPTIYLSDLRLVNQAPTGGQTGTSPSLSAAIPISGPQPFTGVPNHPNEYAEAKGALQWLPQIKWAVGDAVAAGLLRPEEAPLFENVLLGMVGVESAGKLFLVPNPSSDWHSQGLTQLTFANTYREENPFDPLTNLRNALRAVIRYYRRWGNRWDRAVAQHLTGAEDENTQRYSRDWNGTSGQDYAERVVNVVWWAHQLEQNGDLYPPHDNAYQTDCGSCWFNRAPPWNIWDSPALPYNWLPPPNNTAYNYVQIGVDANIQLPIATDTWMPVPGWFYTTSPAPDVAPYQPPTPSQTDRQIYPAGRTTNSPWGDTYPRQTWSPGS